jgi:hypothetical protein
VVQPSFQVFSRSSKAINKTRSDVVSCWLWVAGVIRGFLLHGDKIDVMEKKLTNSGLLRASTRKHSIYALGMGLLHLHDDVEARGFPQEPGPSS